MNPHPPRWGTFTLALLLALVLLGWAWWEQDLLDSEDAGLVLAIALIVLGVVGIAATAWRSRPRRTRPAEPETPEPTPVARPADGPVAARTDGTEPTQTLSTPQGDDDGDQEAHPQH